MPRLTVLQNAFNAGEFSPLMYGRTNYDRYRAAAKTLQNWQIIPQGGLVRRSGTRFLQNVKYPGRLTILRNFIYADDQAYILEWGHKYIRFYRDEGYLGWQTLRGLRANITTSEVAFVGHGYEDGDGPVRLTTDGTLPGGVSLATDYYMLLTHSITLDPLAVDVTYDPEVEVVAGASNYFNKTAHGYTDEMGPFRFEGGSILPAGLNYETDYYVIYTNANRFQVETSIGGGAIAFSTVGTGIHSFVPTTNYKRDSFRFSTVASDITTARVLTPLNDEFTVTPYFPSTPTPPIEVSTPYTEAQLQELSFTQSADVLYMFHEKHPPMKLSRRSSWGFAFDEVEWIDGPYLDENTTAATIDASAATGLITLLASAPMWIAGDVGRLVRLNTKTSSPTHWGYAKIVAINETNFKDSAFNDKAFSRTDVDTGSDRIEFGTAHGIATGEVVRVKMDDPGDSPPGGLLEGVSYFADAITSNRMKFYRDEARTDLVDITSKGDGSGYVTSSLFNIGTHGYIAGAGPLQLTNTGGTLPEGLEVGQDYFIDYVSAGTFYLTLASGGGAVGVDRAGGGGQHSISGDDTPVQTATALVIRDFEDHAVTDSWRLGAWCGRPDVGYPRTGVLHAQRLFAASNTGQRQTIWGSKSGDYEAFSPTGDVTDDITDLDYSVNEDNAITYTIGGSTANVIHWLATGQSLIAGTSSAIWSGGVSGSRSTQRNRLTDPTASPAGVSGVLSPANFTMSRNAQLGALKTYPIEVEERLLYISKSATKIYSTGYSFQEDSLLGEDAMMLSEHIGRPGLVELAFAQEPYSTAYVVRSDGILAPFTVIRQQEVAAWGRHVLGGSWVEIYDRSFTTTDISTTADTITDTAHGKKTGERIRIKLGTDGTLPSGLAENLDYFMYAIDANTLALYTNLVDALADTNRVDISTTGAGTHTYGISTDAVVESVGVIPAPEGDPSAVGRANRGHDQVWMIVKRTVLGETVRQIEFYEDLFEQDEPLEDYFGLDSGLTYTGADTAGPITGLTHLAGETVDMLANGREYRGLVVDANGSMVIPETISAPAHIGKWFVTDFAPLRLSVQNAEGAEVNQGRVDHIVLRLVASLGGALGADEAGLLSFGEQLQSPYQLMDEIPALFSGDIEIALDAPWETEGDFLLRLDRPLPFTLLAIATNVQKSKRGDRR